MANRTDPHRPGAILPHEYEPVLAYALSHSDNGFPVPSFNVCCPVPMRVVVDAEGRTTDRTEVDPTRPQHGTGPCCWINLLAQGVKLADHGGLGCCTICGSAFIHGSVWKHVPTGEHIHVGHQCEAKYEMLFDLTEYEMQLARHRENAATAILRERNAARRASFLADHPGLAEALETPHDIVRDIKERFTKWCEISPRQVELVFKLQQQVKDREAERASETLVPAPVSDKRITFEGTIVGLKYYESDFGTTLKMTVKVTTPDGIWLAWGTCPSGLSDAQRGDLVRVTARLKPGREPHFALLNRPTGCLVADRRIA